MVRKRTFSMIVIGTAWLAAPSLSAQNPPRQPHAFLEAQVGFTAADIREMEQGRTVTKILDTATDRQVAVFGATWIEATMDAYSKHLRDVEMTEEKPESLGRGILGSPPRLEDFADLRFPEEDLEAVIGCEAGNCEVNLDEPQLLRLQKEVDWSVPEAHDRANEILVELLLELVEQYLQGGDPALAGYRDPKRPSFLQDEYKALLQSSPFLIDDVVELNRYLESYPGSELPGSDQFLYWAKNEFGVRPMVSLHHVIVYPIPSDATSSVVIASKQLYASHYFHTGLELTFLVKDSVKPDTKGFYVLRLLRYRSDGLSDSFAGLARTTAERRVRSSLARSLEATKIHLEKARGKTGSK